MKITILVFYLLSACLVNAQQAIYHTNTYGQLFKIDVNCGSEFIGDAEHQYGDIALTDDGRLWGIQSGDLYLIDTDYATPTLIGNFGLSNNSIVGLNDSILFTEAEMDLYSINVNTLATHLIGEIGWWSCGDLTWFNEYLYMTFCGRLIRIKLNDDNSEIVNVVAVNPEDSPIPNCEGLITAQFEDGRNYIVGLCNNDAYKICHVDGSFELLCPALSLNGLPGGAASKLPFDADPEFCSPATSIQEIHYQPEIIVSPNPVSSDGILHIKFANDISSEPEVRIYSANGQLIISGNMNSQQGEIQISLSDLNLTKGIYSLSTSNNSQAFNSMFVVE